MKWAPLPLRLIVGYGFLQHGIAKLIKGPAVFASILHAMNVPMPLLMAWATIATELCGGLAVLVGLWIAIASVPMAAVLLVAIFTVHLPFGFSSIKLIDVTAGRTHFGPPGYECDLLYLACLISLVLSGSGPFSMGHLTKKRSESFAGHPDNPKEVQ